MKRIGIIGGGSLGLLLGSYLQDDLQVTVYVRRKDQKEQLSQHGILCGQRQRPVLVELIDDLKQEDLLIITVKQYDIENVLTHIRKNNQKTTLLFLQNGMGHIKYLQQLMQIVVVGIVEHGAYRKNDYTVEHTGIGEIKIASFNHSEEFTRNIQQLIDQPNFPVSVHGDWKQLLLDKLMINATINPLTAILNIKNGELLTNDYAYKLLKHLTFEVAQILQLPSRKQFERVKIIAEITAANTSSMLQDIKAKKQTEIDAILGYLLKVPSSIDKPYTTFAYHSIKALETRGH